MMTRSFLALAGLLVLHIAGCRHEHPVAADIAGNNTPIDSVFSNIDTSLHIQMIREGNLTIFTIDKFKTVVVKIPRITSYFFDPHPVRSLQQIGLDSNFALVMNTSFIDEFTTYGPTDTIVTFRHAGYLKINNVLIENLKVERQITALLAYDSRKNRVDYFELNELDKTQGYDLVVQTGPLIVHKSLLDSVTLRASINADRPVPRTLFASVNGQEFYAIVTPSYVTLDVLGAMLMSSGIFKKELDIIDFDGGPSTSLYIRNHPELCTYPNQIMPALMGVR
jgi:hypothetical protein